MGSVQLDLPPDVTLLQHRVDHHLGGSAPTNTSRVDHDSDDYHDPLLHQSPPLGPTPFQYEPVRTSFWPKVAPGLWQQFPQYCLMYSAVNNSRLPNHLSARITVPSGLHLYRWDALLSDYHDRDLLTYLRYGWPVGFTGSAPPTPVGKNHTSAEKYPGQIQAFITKELGLGGLLGPFDSPPFSPWTSVAPLLTTKKKDSSDRRVVLDLSFPDGQGINGSITRNCLEGKSCHYTLPSV